MRFESRLGRTCLPHLTHQGPLRVQRPFYPEGPVCHIYLLHPPGGLVSGDQIAIGAELAAGAQALITTPSAGKIYKGDRNGVAQSQQLQLRVADGASLEWLPQETIAFDGAQGESSSRIELGAESRYIGWEIVCLGHPASGIDFKHGGFKQNLEIYREGAPLLLERQHLLAASKLAKSSWGLQGQPVYGALYAVGFDTEPVELISAMRAELPTAEQETVRVSITWRLGVLVVRYLGAESEQARQCFTALWQILRPALLHRTAEIPRIWMT